MLRRARLGGQYGRIQRKRAEGAIVTRRPLWVCMAWAIAAEVARDLLQALPVSRPQSPDHMARRLDR